ncbi:MAG: hypothetical protein GY737_26385, partial [Desulfobacteraceae bacterium]|nr:hypothetical protein [Desulfobacteraceae bacterium]
MLVQLMEKQQKELQFQREAQQKELEFQRQETRRQQRQDRADKAESQEAERRERDVQRQALCRQQEQEREEKAKDRELMFALIQQQSRLFESQTMPHNQTSHFGAANVLTYPAPTLRKFFGRVGDVFQPWLDEFNMCTQDYPDEFRLRYLTSSLTGEASKLFVSFAPEIQQSFARLTAELNRFYRDTRTVVQLLMKHQSLKQLTDEPVVQFAARFQQSERDSFKTQPLDPTSRAFQFYQGLRDDVRPEVISENFTFDFILAEAIKKEDKKRISAAVKGTVVPSQALPPQQRVGSG